VKQGDIKTEVRFVILTNQWTDLTHGHGRTELRLVQALLNEAGVRSETLSVSPHFGDIQVQLKKLDNLLPRLIVRGPIYRQTLKYQANELSKTWERTLITRSNDSTLAITSGFWPQLIATLKIKAPNKTIFRLISPPDVEVAKNIEVNKVRHALSTGKLTLGIETLDGMEYLENKFGITAFLVPPLCSVNGATSRQTKTGIIWPVTDKSSSEEISHVIEQFEGSSLVIKLPVGIEANDISCISDEIEVIPNGITDEFFAAQIGKLKYVYLPHKGYLRRGSGLVTSMLGSGIVVMAQKNNSFMQDFAFSKLLIGTDDSKIKATFSEILKSDISKDERQDEAGKINRYIKHKWLELFGLNNE
jgi:hypothetical protein